MYWRRELPDEIADAIEDASEEAGYSSPNVACGAHRHEMTHEEAVAQQIREMGQDAGDRKALLERLQALLEEIVDQSDELRWPSRHVPAHRPQDIEGVLEQILDQIEE